MTEKSILDPVCGHKVNLEVALIYPHENTDYFFCSKKCQNLFKRNPKKYIAIHKNASYLKRKVTSNLENIPLYIKEIVLKINDLNIDSKTIIDKINSIKGVESLNINSKSELYIKYNEDVILKKTLLDEIDKLDCKISLIKEKDVILSINSFEYPSSCFFVETNLLKLNGIKKVKADFLSDEILIKYIPEEIKITEIISQIEDIGFKVIIHEHEKDKKNIDKSLNNLKNNLLLAFILTFGIFIFNIIKSDENILYNLFIILFSTIVNVGSGLFLLKRSLNDFKSIYLSEGLILFTAGLVTYFYSLVEFFIPEFTISSKTFFDISSSIISLSLFSLYLVSILKKGIQNNISYSLKSFLISKNLESVKNTKLPNIIKQMYISEYKIEKLSNIVLKYFPIYIIIFALSSFLITFFFKRDIGFYSSLLNSLNIIILATINLPYLTINLLKIQAFFRLTESNKFIFRNNESFENMGKLKNIILAKKGVITKDKPFITDIVTFEHFDGNTILKYVASIENYSSGSISEAIIKETKQKMIDLWIPDSVHSFSGLGIEAKIKNYDITIGSKNFLKLKNIDVSIVSKLAKNLSSDGKTEIFISISNKISAMIALFDNIKSNTLQIVNILKNNGINIFILSGDNNLVSQFWSNKLNIPKENIITELTPAKKVKKIEMLQKELGVVGVITKNFEDKPYLKKADVVLSFSNELCSEEIKGISILDNELSSLSLLIEISRNTINKIFRNFSILTFFILFVILSSLFQGFYGLYLEPLSLGVLIIIILLFQIVSFTRKK